jgi:hypothetical protein
VTTTPPVPGLEHAFDVDARLGPLEDHGVTRAGHRRVIAIAGGRVSGLFDAEILPGGADWQLVRPDGTIEIDVYLETSAPRLAVLERSLYVASAVRGADSVSYRAYRVT